MLTHDWGVDGTNHARVREVNNILTRMGVCTWFDEEMLQGNIIEGMTRGIDTSTWVVVFITKRYIEKIAAGLKKVTLLRSWLHHLPRYFPLARGGGCLA